MWDSLPLDQTEQHFLLFKTLKYYLCGSSLLCISYAMPLKLHYNYVFKAIAIAIIYYGSAVESMNLQILRLRGHFYVWQQVGQLLLFHPNIAPEVALECLKFKIFLGKGRCPQTPLVETDNYLTNHKFLATSL